MSVIRLVVMGSPPFEINLLDIFPVMKYVCTICKARCKFETMTCESLLAQGSVVLLINSLVFRPPK